MTKPANTIIPKGFKVTKCPPTNCAKESTNSITRRSLTKERRQFKKEQEMNQ